MYQEELQNEKEIEEQFQVQNHKC